MASWPALSAGPTLKSTVVTTGYLAVDSLHVEGELFAHTAGGTAANVAAILAYFGWTASVAGLLGTDVAGGRFAREMKRNGVDVSQVQRDSAVGTPVVLHFAEGQRHKFLFVCPLCGRKTARHRPLPITRAVALLERVEAPGVFFFDRASVAAVALATGFRAAGSLIMFEPGVRGRSELMQGAADLAHVLKYSIEQESELDPGVIEAREQQLQIRTAGKAGAAFRIGDGRWVPSPAAVVDAVDSAGAGDWLTATFLAAVRDDEIPWPRWKQSLIQRTLRVSQLVAALSCRYMGARGLMTISPATLRRHRDTLGGGGQLPPPHNLQRRVSTAAVQCAVCLASGQGRGRGDGRLRGSGTTSAHRRRARPPTG